MWIVDAVNAPHSIELAGDVDIEWAGDNQEWEDTEEKNETENDVYGKEDDNEDNGIVSGTIGL